MVWRVVFNSLGILGTAMFAGVMLAIGVILGGHWKSLPAKEFLASLDRRQNESRYRCRRRDSPSALCPGIGLMSKLMLLADAFTTPRLDEYERVPSHTP